jgi:hypothetical protein
MAEKISRIARTIEWRHQFIRAHEYRCHYCNRFAGSVEVGPDGRPWHVEHMNALANGGADVDENLTLSCERCNSLKATLPYENFRRYARCSLWAADRSRLDLKDLESLEAAYLRTTGGNWMSRRVERDEYTTQVFAIDEGEYDTDACADVVGEFPTPGGRSGGEYNVRFLIEAHRLIPQMIAEIHLLRAELSAARTQSREAAPVDAA